MVIAPMGTCNPRGVTSVLPASYIGIIYLMESVMVMSRWGPGCGAAALRDRLPVLWRCIEDAHYSYLEMDDSPDKLHQRKKLEGFITEYLSLVPHECKFGLSETGEVFNRTVSQPEFNAYRAGLGWAALARYAGNLLAQPWRKEYRIIRLYSGYYKHEVEANMTGGETLMMAMGYRTERLGRLVLDGPACPDTVAAISRDALIAHVECKVMAQIWEAVWGCGAPVTWAQVAAERSHRPGDAAASAARLAALHAGRDYVDGPEVYTNMPVTVPLELPHNRIAEPRLSGCDHITPPNETPEEPILPIFHAPSYIVPTPHVMQPNLIYPVPPQTYPEVPVTINPCNTVPVMGPYGAVPYYYAPIQAPYMMPTPVYAPVKHATTMPINGYSQLPQYKYPAVPTAQLIEIESPSVYENGGKVESRMHKDEERYRKPSHRQQESTRKNCAPKPAVSDASLASIPRSDTQPALSKAREDGMGTYESWDYVFRNLASKEQEDGRNRYSPSNDRDSRTLDRLDREERRSRYQPTTLDLEDGMQALTVDRSYDDELYRTAKVNENLMRIKHESEQKKAKQLAKKQAIEEKKIKKQITQEPIGNPLSDALITNKTPPDKVRLLTKKEVKDKKEIVKQQNGPVSVNAVDVKKVKKTIKPTVTEVEKTSRSKQPQENGLLSIKNPTASSSTHSQQNHYDLKTHLVVSLDQKADNVRKSPPRHALSDPVPSISRPSREKSKDSTGIEVKTTAAAGKWECGFCTYLNCDPATACEMCGKSRNLGPESAPLTSGGRECPACTLVNRRDAACCDACGSSLDHCPTYI
ncbi:Protein tamozhennic [Eumeta japonica]|uniref:Protein tamozhennic n=1 Tax=Eumeta variegata TaxID=151549 RepID=A0A4C1U8C8_EUMVA|nr:Protein tamozhennic [Eumeta japonica]